MYTVIIIPPPRVYHIPNYACIIRLQEESFSATLEPIVFVQQSKSFSFQILCQAHLFILFLVSTTSSLCSCQQYLESKQYLSIFYTDTLSEQKYMQIEIYYRQNFSSILLFYTNVHTRKPVSVPTFSYIVQKIT